MCDVVCAPCGCWCIQRLKERDSRRAADTLSHRIISPISTKDIVGDKDKNKTKKTEKALWMPY